jgi:hypothetical protein
MIEATYRSCMKMLSSSHGAQLYKWPTFIDGENKIQDCPIISARCVALLDISGVGRREAANKILYDVAYSGWQSQWFSDQPITEGFVLYYLSALCDEDCAAAFELVKHLREFGQSDRLRVEAAAAALMGLKEAKRCLNLDFADDRSIMKLSRFLLDREEDGHWKPSRVGVFGFGRSYGDPVFSTALAFLALAG